MASLVNWGFDSLAQQASQRVNSGNAPAVMTAIEQTVAQQNRDVNSYVSFFAEKTEDHKVRFLQRDKAMLQPMDEWGNPLPRRPQGFYDVAFPIEGAGTAYGSNRITRALQTIGDVRRNTLEMVGDDAAWVQQKLLEAILDSGEYTYVDEMYGTLTVKPFANGDAAEYPFTNGTVATDNHYLAQTAGISASANPLPTIHTELTEHPGNRGNVVVFTAANCASAITGMTGFLTTPQAYVRPATSADSLTGFPNVPFGKPLGYKDNCFVVQWDALPSNYLVGVTTNAMEPALKMREYPANELKGLFMENNSPDGNLQETRYLRYCGFGAYDRTGIVAYQVSGDDTTYDVPTGYDRPTGK